MTTTVTQKQKGEELYRSRLEWHAIQGARSRVTLHMAADREIRTQMRAPGVIGESTRELTVLFLRLEGRPRHM